MREDIRFLKFAPKHHNILDSYLKTLFKCNVLEDDDGCIRVANSPKFTPCAYHIGMKHHSCQRSVNNITIEIKSIDAEDPGIHFLTKLLLKTLFEKQYYKWMGQYDC